MFEPEYHSSNHFAKPASWITGLRVYTWRRLFYRVKRMATGGSCANHQAFKGSGYPNYWRRNQVRGSSNPPELCWTNQV